MRERRPTISGVNFFCPAFGVGDGYGNSAQYICMALEQIGIQVAIKGNPQMGIHSFVAPVGHIICPEIWERYRDPVKARAVPFYENFICYSTPESFSPRAVAGNITRRSIGFTMFECDRIPDGWVPMLQKVDMLLVPSHFNREVFGKHYPIENIHVAPLGVDYESFPYQERRRGDVLRFLHFSSVCTEFRKGADLAYAAFQKAFPGREDVYLEINCRVPQPGTTAEQAWKTLAIDDPRVQLVFNLKTVQELRDLYYTFDCLIYPSRGEGFGLIPLEAMSTGLPAIHTGSSGMGEFRDLGMTVGYEIKKAQIGRGRLPDEVFQTWHNTTGSWYEPNLDELVDRMREVDQEYRTVQARAARDSKSISQRFAWRNTALAVQAALEGWD